MAFAPVRYSIGPVARPERERRLRDWLRSCGPLDEACRSLGVAAQLAMIGDLDAIGRSRALSPCETALLDELLRREVHRETMRRRRRKGQLARAEARLAQLRGVG